MLVKALLNGQVTGGISSSGMQAGKETNTAEGMGRTANSLSQSAATVEWASHNRFRYRTDGQRLQMESQTGGAREYMEYSGGLENAARRDAHAKALAIESNAASGDRRSMNSANEQGSADAGRVGGMLSGFLEAGKRMGFTGSDTDIINKTASFVSALKTAKEGYGANFNADAATRVGEAYGLKGDAATQEGLAQLEHLNASKGGSNFLNAVKAAKNNGATTIEEMTDMITGNQSLATARGQVNTSLYKGEEVFGSAKRGHEDQEVDNITKTRNRTNEGKEHIMSDDVSSNGLRVQAANGRMMNLGQRGATIEQKGDMWTMSFMDDENYSYVSTGRGQIGVVKGMERGKDGKVREVVDHFDMSKAEIMTVKREKGDMTKETHTSETVTGVSKKDITDVNITPLAMLMAFHGVDTSNTRETEKWIDEHPKEVGTVFGVGFAGKGAKLAKDIASLPKIAGDLLGKGGGKKP